MKDMVIMDESTNVSRKKGFLDRFKEDGFLKALAALLIFEIIFQLINLVFRVTGIDFGYHNSGAFFREIIIKVVPAVALTFVFKTADIYKNGKRFFRSLTSGILFMIIVPLGCFSLISSMVDEGTAFKSPVEILFYVLFLLCVGISEESLCRGIITETMLRKHGQTKKGIWLSALVGASFFSLLHFSNLFAGQSLVDTLLQMYGTFSMGFLFTAVYIRHRNIYAVAFLHAFLDFMTIWDSGMVQGNSILHMFNETTETHVLSTILVNSIFVIPAIIVLRRKKLEEVINREKKQENRAM